MAEEGSLKEDRCSARKLSLVNDNVVRSMKSLMAGKTNEKCNGEIHFDPQIWSK